jgi:hypothetical protein
MVRDACPKVLSRCASTWAEKSPFNPPPSKARIWNLPPEAGASGEATSFSTILLPGDAGQLVLDNHRPGSAQLLWSRDGACCHRLRPLSQLQPLVEPQPSQT